MSLVAVATSGASLLSGLFGHPKDPERKAKAEEAYRKAKAGDEHAYRQLVCWSGDQRFAAEFNALQPPGCGFATDYGRAIAKGLVAKLDAERAVAGAAGHIVSGATAVGVQTDPGTFTATVADDALPPAVSRILPGGDTTKWLLIAAGVGLAIYLVKR